MSDPLQGYFQKDTSATATAPAGDPLAGYFGTPTETQPDYETAVGRENAKIQNLQDNIARLKTIKPANPEHAARIAKLIASYERQLPRYAGFVPGESDPTMSGAKNVLSGFFSGIPQGAMGGAALAGAVIAPGGKGPFKALSEQVAEASAQVREDVPSQGVAGALGETVGQLAGGTLPYGTAAEIAATKIAVAAPKSFVARAVTAGAEGTMGQRITRNLVGGVPLNVIQAVGQPVSGDAEHDLAARAKQFGIGTLADILFGMLPGHVRKPKTEPKVAAAGEPSAAVAPERTANFLEIQATRKAREAKAAYDREAKTQARAEWQVANQGKKWTELIPDDRKTLISQWKERHPTTDTSTPDSPVIAEQQAAIDAGPQEIKNPVEVAGVVAQVQKALEDKGVTDVKATELMQTLQEADRRVQERAADAVVWTAEERSKFITDRQKAFAAKINKPWSQWTPSEKVDYVADQMAIRKELADTRARAGEAPTGAPEGASGNTPASEPPSGVIEGDNFDQIVAEVQAKGGLTNPEDLAAFNQELIAIHEKPLSPEEHAQEVQSLIEDFTPLNPAESQGATGADVPGAAGQRPVAKGASQSRQGFEATGSESVAAGRETPQQATAIAGLDEQLQKLNRMTLDASAKAADPGFMEELQNHYNAIKERFGLTDEQLAEQQMRAMEETGDLTSKLRTGTGTVGAGFDPSLFKKLGANMYKGDITKVAVKEGIQNAIDAVRPMLSKGQPGRINVKVDEKNSQITFRDNGEGMSPEIVEKEFVDIGGSAKSSAEGMSGGYGLAKVGLFSQAAGIHVVTTAKKGNKVTTTILQGSGQDWINGNMKMTTRDAHVDTPTGTSMVLTFHPEKEGGGQHNWYSAITSLGNFEKYNRTGVVLDIKTTDWAGNDAPLSDIVGTATDFNEKPYTKDLKSAGIEIFPSKDYREAGSIQVHVLNNGLYQFTDHMYLGKAANIPEELMVDVSPKVDVNNENYPFTTSREELKSEVKEVLQEFVKNLQGESQKREAANLFKSLKDAPAIKDPKTGHESLWSVYATDGAVEPSTAEAVSTAPYSERLAEGHSYITDMVWKSARLEFPNIPLPGFGGFGLGADYIGLNINREAVVKFAAEQGVEGAAKQMGRMILVNPFTTMLERLQKLGLTAQNLDELDIPTLTVELAHSSIGTIVHEMAHQIAGGHNEQYAGVLTRILSRSGEIHPKLYDEMLQSWEHVLGKPHIRERFFDDLDAVSHQWGSNNVFKDFSGHLVPEPGGGHAGSSDAASNALRSSQGSTEGGTAAGSESAGSLPAESGSIQSQGGEPATLPRLAKGDGLDAQRAALFKQLVSTPLHERGPILLKIRELNAAMKPEAPLQTQPTVLPEARSTPATTDSHATRSSVTQLETIDSKPLEELNPRKIETITDRLLVMLESTDPGTPDREAMHRDLEKLMAFERAGETGGAAIRQVQPALPEGAVVRPEPPPSVTGAEQVTRTVEPPVQGLDPKVARKLFQSQLKRMDSGDLDAHIEDMQSRVSVLGKDEGKPYRERLDKALEERAERFQSQAGVKLHIPPAAGGFTAGFIGGFLSTDDETDKLTNALAWGAVGAAVGMGAGKYLRRGGDPAVTARTGADLPGGAWQEEIHKHVVTDYERGVKPTSLREKMRHIYTGIVRRTLSAERFIESVGASRLGAERNAAKLLGMYGRWTGQTESALKYGPAIFDEFGNYKKLDSLGVDDILAMVDGDVETLGDLMAARTKVEMGDAIKTPFNTVAAEKMFFSVPENFHKAADEMRKFSLAMAEVLVDGGVLSRDGLTKFRAETMYATLQRVFKMDSAFATSAEAKSSAVVKASSPLKTRKGGGDTQIKNPVESTIASVPWYYRAAEQNKIKHSLVDAWEAAGSLTALMRRVTKAEIKVSPEHEAKIASLKAEIKGLDDENAHALVAGLDPTSIDPLEGTMRVYRDGVVESYKMPKELALALQTMNSEDVGMLTKILGAPARLATKGITYNPFFLAKMGFFDAWQATLNSQYGFRFGLDNMRGWLHEVFQSKKYQELLGVGFAHQSFAASRESFSTKMESVRANTGSPIEIAVKQLREMKPIEAYKTLVAPIGDAARVGEALRALDHGASTIEAAYAGKQVTANYGEIGQFAQMRALNHIIMFLNPALQVMDQSFYRMGVHPFRVSEEGRMSDMVRYGTKAFASITLPTMLLWAKYHDDEEITQMRQTRAGARYWFMRSPVKVPGVVDQGEIIKIPKPILDGQVWGTSMEATLDNLKGTDPQSASAVASSLLRDAAFNILPTVGQIPYSLQANQDLSWGGTIIPLADDQLALEHQGEDRASWISREISKKVGPLAQGSDNQMLRNAVTPAGLDFIIRSVGGMLGQDAVTAISQAMEAQTKGYVPAKEELPLIKNVVVDYPSTKTRDIEQFYDRLGSVQTVGKTMSHLAVEDPEKLIGYMENNQADYMLVGAFGQARQTIANFRRAIVDVRRMDSSEIDPASRREIIKTYIQLMQQTAATAMMQAKEIDGALK